MNVEMEMTRLLNILPYERIFTIEESLYKELVCEFQVTFKYYSNLSLFELEESTACFLCESLDYTRIWTVEETISTKYANVV